MKRLFNILLVISITHSISKGQNLIKNPLFDNYFTYYDENNNLVYNPTDWNYVDSILNHPIYYSTDRYLNKTIKWNFHPDSESIKNGEISNYISLLILPNVHRAYTKLSMPLKKNTHYRLSIDVKAFSQSNYFSDLLVGFKETIDNNMDSSSYQLKLLLPDSACCDILYKKWFTLETEFIAKGNENILIISSGSKENYKEIIYSNENKYEIRPYSGSPSIKYFVDNIYLTEIENNQNHDYYLKFDTLTVGKNIILENIYFDFDKCDLRKTSFQELDRLFSFMAQNTEVIIQIDGHTDNFGKDEYNNELSLNRANSIKNYLVNKGLKSERISAKGLGEKSPIDSNETSLGRQKNRRIEITIIDR